MGIGERGKEKSRGRETRNRKPVLLIATEGKNKTEKNYLSHFAPFSKYAINFNANHCTDPVNLMKSLVNDITKKQLNSKDGDRAVCVFDTDMQKDNKQDQINIAMKYQNSMIKAIISCPCIEIWFLCHFAYSTKEYASNKEVLLELQTKIPEYDKAKDIFSVIFPMTDAAIANAKKLEMHHVRQQHNLNSFESNPSSQFYWLIEEILSQ